MHKSAHIVWILAALLLLPLSTAQATKLYKWVDQSGQVHYSQSPPAAGQGEASEVEIPRSALGQPQQQITAKEPAADAEADDTDAMTPDEIRQKNCENARANLEIYQRHERIRQADGQVIELNEESRAARIAEAEGMISEFCD